MPVGPAAMLARVLPAACFVLLLLLRINTGLRVRLECQLQYALQSFCYLFYSIPMLCVLISEA